VTTIGARQRRTVLVVDDDADLRASLSQTLGDEGYHVMVASDGKDAWDQLIRNKPPSLMILDLRMPRKSGEEVLQLLKQSPTFVNIPVVILSAYLTFPPAGAVAWLKKPVQAKTLLSVVQEYAPLAASA
jgi:CheY-like chemotaxis protein